MNALLDDDFREIDLAEYSFMGKLAGKSWKREEAVARLANVRIVIFAMSALVLVPIFASFAFHNYFESTILIERAVFSVILIVCGLTFPKFRLASMILALLPLGLILSSYLIYTQFFSIKAVAFSSAAFLWVSYGIYNHFIEKRLRQELATEIKSGNPDAKLKKETAGQA